MKFKTVIRRTAAAVLCLGLLIGGVFPSAADAGVQPVYDETYYATTDWYGNLTQGSVVKSYTLNGVTAVRDFGSYASLTNLTDGSEPEYEGGAAVFRTDDAARHLHFEGVTAKPFEELPWKLSVRYTLNGVPTRAEELPEQKGVVEIIIDAERNDAASDYAKQNYTMEIAALFHQNELLSLEAEGAQVQLIGDLKAVLFLAMPGETVHRVIRVGTEDFSFGGLTVLMIPATLGQLKEVGKISENKTKLEENYRKLSGALDATMDALDGAQDQLLRTASGLETLNEARGMLHDGEQAVNASADAVLGDLSALAVSLAKLPKHLNSADETFNETLDAVKNVNTAVHKIGTQYDEIQDSLYSLKAELKAIADAGYAAAYDLDRLGAIVDELDGGMTKLLTGLGELQLGIGSGELTIHGMTPDRVAKKLADAQTLETLYSLTADGSLGAAGFVAKMLLVSGQAATDAAAEPMAEQLTQLVSAVDGMAEQAMAADGTLTREAALAEALAAVGSDAETYAAAKKLLGLYAAVSGKTMSQKEFFLTVLPMSGMDEDTAEELWTVYRKSKGLSRSLDKLASVFGGGGISGDLADLLTAVGNSVTELRDLARHEDKITDALDETLTALQSLTELLDGKSGELKETLDDLKTLTETIGAATEDLTTFLQTVKSLLNGASEKLNTGGELALDGLASTFRAAADTIGTSDELRAAKGTITDIIEDVWHDYTGEVNTMLMMDAEALPVSLTDPRNPAPQSVQILISTAAIDRDTVEEEREKQQPPEPAAEKPMTFWDRVAQMFRDLWASFCGLFR